MARKLSLNSWTMMYKEGGREETHSIKEDAKDAALPERHYKLPTSLAEECI